MTELESELLQNVKHLLLDLQGCLEMLDLNLHTATGLAPSAENALAMVKRLDPEWEDPTAYELKIRGDISVDADD